jgi:hypothetical protein
MGGIGVREFISYYNCACFRINPQECIAKGLSLYAKIRVHGRESVKPKIKYETNQNSETTADCTGQAKSGIDPYIQEAEKKKKAGFGKKIFKFIKWTILSTLLLGTGSVEWDTTL